MLMQKGTVFLQDNQSNALNSPSHSYQYITSNQVQQSSSQSQSENCHSSSSYNEQQNKKRSKRRKQTVKRDKKKLAKSKQLVKIQQSQKIKNLEKLQKSNQKNISGRKPKEQLIETKNKTIQQYAGFIKKSCKKPKSEQKIALYELSDSQSNYIQKSMLPKGYSLKPQNQEPQQSKSKIKVGQTTLERFYPGNKMYQFCKQTPKYYSEGYSIALKIIDELMNNQKVHPFFKYKFKELKKMQIVNQKEYADYFLLISQESIRDLATIKEMVENPACKQIQNFQQFFMAIQQMITNSYRIHVHLRKKQMLIATKQLQRQFYQIFLQHYYPQHNLTQPKAIKTFSKQKPKLILAQNKIKIQQSMENNPQQEKIQFLDLNDENNKNRIAVMNLFLKRAFQENEQKLHQNKTNLLILIQRSKQSQITVIQNKSQQQTKQSLNKINQQSASVIISQNSYQSTPKLSKKPCKSISSAQTKSKKQYYQIKPHVMTQQLFHNLRNFIRKLIQQNKRKRQNGNNNQEEERRRKLYPHQDSNSFQIQDQSNS